MVITMITYLRAFASSENPVKPAPPGILIEIFHIRHLVVQTDLLYVEYGYGFTSLQSEHINDINFKTALGSSQVRSPFISNTLKKLVWLSVLGEKNCGISITTDPMLSR